MDIQKPKFQEQEDGLKTDEDMDFEETEKGKENIERDQKLEAQAKLIDEQAKELKCIKDQNEELLKKIDASKGPKIKVSQEVKPIPDHLSPVQGKHLKDLLGIRMKCDGNMEGDCLSSCTTMHLSNTRSNSERKRVNGRINHHIADHYDTFYKTKISLPYSETVGVGENARQVTCATREEFLSFLRSEESLCAYSNSHELLAIANMLNMKIHIFTYGIRGNSDNWGWNSIFPDPEMAQYSKFGQGTLPDMLLYNSDSTHYDLLVKDNSRLAVLGLISISEEKEAEKEVALKEVAQKEVALKAVVQKEVAPKEVAHKEVAKEELDKEKPTSGVKGDRNEEQWKTVNNSRKKTVPRSKNSKAPGGDLTSAPSKEKACDTNKCKECNFRADSVQQLNNHMRTHDETVIPYYCEVCQEEFDSHTEYNNHNKKKHSKQWNCDDCDFQASTRGGLLTHCKLTSGHKPSRVQKSKSGVLKCYTCKSEFRSYHELMEHRKEEHPSHKTCRYYIKGECFF